MHLYHQLIYSESGVIHIWTEEKRSLLPAHHGMWIPANCAHRLASNSSTLKIYSAYFPPEHDDAKILDNVRVFPLPPLAHQMLAYSQRWLEDDETSTLKDSFFETLRLLTHEWCTQSLSLELPLPTEPIMIDITKFILDHLDSSLKLAYISHQYGISERTLMRYFQADLGITFSRYIQVARISRAAEWLANPDATVTDVALAVGYRSPSSFSQAFQLLVGQSPSEYLRSKKGARE